jgi:hypothetical protein
VNPCQILVSNPRHENVSKHRAFVMAHHLSPLLTKTSGRLLGAGVAARKSKGQDLIRLVGLGRLLLSEVTKKAVSGDHTICGLIYSLGRLFFWAVVGKSKTSTLMCWGSLLGSEAWRPYVAQTHFGPIFLSCGYLSRCCPSQDSFTFLKREQLG